MFLILQLAALALFNPSDQMSKSEEMREEVRRDTADSHVPGHPPGLSPGNPAEAIPSSRCEITHKDSISALSRATTSACKARIEETYCAHKEKTLLPAEIKRTCRHQKTFIAKGDNVEPADYRKDAKVSIAYFLIVHGRSVRQIKRLFKMIYHVDHFFYFHVDVRSDYLYGELVELMSDFTNVQIAPWREAPIWGGTSLLTTIMKGLVDLLRIDHKWDFFINLSFADLPVKTNEHLTQFLFKHKDKNFMKSHGREADKFIKKQGLNRLFLECENHMWRLGERELPKGITVDGGSDWIALNRKFVDFLINSGNEQVDQFKVWFNYTLLPAESFFHTVVQNSEHCESFVDNNLRMTNWNRARGCKCQYKAIVDWCGCSPNDFMVSDLARLKTARPIFFARKFEEFVSQEPVTRLDNELYGEYPAGTPSIQSYWENIWSSKDHKSINENKPDWGYDAKLSVFGSWDRDSRKKAFGSRYGEFSTAVSDVTIFQTEQNQVKTGYGYVMRFTSTDPATEKPLVWESFVTPVRRQEETEEETDIKVEVSTGANWDVKELVFRDPGGIVGTFSPVHVSFRFKNVQKKFQAVAVVQDPSGYPADQLDMEIPEDESVRAKRPKSSTYHCEGKLGQEVVAAEKLALRHPLRPGVWTISLYIRHSRTTQYIPGSKTSFLVSPLTFAYGNKITKNAHTVNRGVQNDDELNEKNKDLKPWTKLISGASGDSKFLAALERNSTFLSAELEGWVDEISRAGWTVSDVCSAGRHALFPAACENSYWSTLYPDPKSEFIPVNADGRIR